PPPPDAEAQAPEPSERKWNRLSARATVAAFTILVAGIAAILLPIDRFGEKPKYRIPEPQALAAADAFLRSHGIDPASYQNVAAPAAHWDGADELAGKYMLERSSLA